MATLRGFTITVKMEIWVKCTVIKVMEAMRSLVRKIRERIHPLFYARKSPLGRFAIRILDQPAWLSVEGVTFKVRGGS
jgi:hypothetical protein